MPYTTVIIIDNATGLEVARTTSDSYGFFEVRNLGAGSYTVLGMNAQGRSVSVPTPVVLETEGTRVSNARVNIFIDNDHENYFPIFLCV
jgi:hypothetical protein